MSLQTNFYNTIWAASQVLLVVKNLPANARDSRDAGSIPASGRSPWVGNGNLFSILAWIIPWTEEPDGLQSMRSQRIRHNWAHKYTHPIGKWKKITFILYTHSHGFPRSSVSNESACSAGDPDSIPGWEDPLEKEMASHSSILAWRIPCTEEPGRLQSVGSQELDTT